MMPKAEEKIMQRENRLFCNCCGKEICIEIGSRMEEYYHLRKSWGYFSRKDGVTQAADICEACMDAWLGSFQIPPERIERTELFEC